MAWSDTLQESFGTVVNAGADLLKTQAEAAARANNAPVKPSDAAWTKYQPALFAVVLALVAAVVIMLIKKR